MNKGIFYASFTALLWGFLAIVLKVSLNELPPVTVAWFRFSIAFVLLTIYYSTFNKNQLGILIKPPPLALIAGLCLGLNYIGFITGVHYTSPSISQIFIQAGPVMLAVSGFLIFKERASVRQVFGLLIVFFGMIIFYQDQLAHFSESISKYRKGVAWILFGAMAWTCYGIFQKKAVKKYDPMQLNLILFGLPALFLMPFVDFKQMTGIHIGDWLLLIFLGLNTLGAYGSLSYALKYLDANKVSVILTLNPLITFAIMAIISNQNVGWLAHEKFTLITLLGAFLVLSGAVLTVTKNQKSRE